MKCFVRTNSQAESFYTLKAKHKHNLHKKGYSMKFINHYTDCVQFNNRHLSLTNNCSKTKKKILAFITRFTPSATKAMKILRNFWPSLQKTKIFHHKEIPNPMLTFKSNKNIKLFLVRAKLSPSLDHQITPFL